MEYIYPAIYYLEEDGQYSVIFPDLNDLATCGNTLAKAIAMAEDACGLYLFTALRDGEILPEPTPLNQISIDEENAFVNMVLVDMNEYSKKYGDKAVKKTLSIPSWLNTLCENQNINFSRVLQDALILKVQNNR